ncbi:MAG: CPBP family intramembrane glutamic endopeptidase [Vulcanimicrobiaceae bacterium]
MNNSTYPTSPAWPTQWPSNSFKAAPTALLILSIVGISGMVLLAGIGLLFAFHDMHRTSVPLVPALAIQFVLEAAVVAVILRSLPRLSGFSLAELGFRLPSAGAIGTAIIGSFAMAIVANGGASLIDALFHTSHEQQVVQMVRNVHDPATLAFFTIFAVVLAPIAEETIFRVLIFNVGVRYRGFWFGAIVSSVLFGVAHGDMFAAVPLALAGIVLCFVYYRTCNAYASMVTHGLFNAFTIVALFAMPHLAK